MVDVVPEADGVLEEALVVAGEKMMLLYTEDVKSRLYVHRLDGRRLKSLDMPVGSVSDMSGRRKHSHFLFSLASFNTPRIIYDVNVESDSFDLTVLRRLVVRAYAIHSVHGVAAATSQHLCSEAADLIPVLSALRTLCCHSQLQWNCAECLGLLAAD